jgi:DnaJ-class molecular chaperone
MNPYQALGVTAGATQDEIKNAYRKLAKRYHPDLNPGSKEAEKRFKEINSAYEQIGSAENRAKFDRGEMNEEAGRGPFYHQTQESGGRYSYSFEGMDDDLFSSFFEGIGGARAQAHARPRPHVTYRLDIEFKDAVLGEETEISLPEGKRLRVKIPPGVDTGTTLRLGDVLVELHVRPSPLFKRDGNDLELELPISVPESLLGAEVRTPTLEGSILMRIPPGASSGQKLRVAGKGVHAKGARGDLYVLLKIVGPRSTDADFKEAVASWARREPYDARAGWAGNRSEP